MYHLLAAAKFCDALTFQLLLQMWFQPGPNSLSQALSLDLRPLLATALRPPVRQQQQWEVWHLRFASCMPWECVQV